MDRKILELEGKVKFLETTIARIKRWVWLKYETRIPRQILENDQNFDDNLVTPFAKLRKKDHKIDRNNELIVSNDHFFDIEPESYDSQIEIEEKIVPLEDLKVDPIDGLNLKRLVIKLKRIDDTRLPTQNQNPERLDLNPQNKSYSEELEKKSSQKNKKLTKTNSINHMDMYDGLNVKINVSDYEIKDSKYGCKICGKLLKSEDSVKRHMGKLHKGGVKSDYGCNVGDCIKRFSQRNALFEHYRFHHMNPESDGYSEEFTKNCPEKVASYIEKRKIWKDTRKENKDLMKSIALKDKVKMACKICGKVFSKKYLRTHIIIHKDSNEWKHVCNVGACIRRFSTKQGLYEHYRAHMNPSSEVYSEEFTKNCPEKALKYIERTKKYLKTFSGSTIMCQICGKSIIRASLSNHLRKHAGNLKFQLRFACKVGDCERKFESKSMLLRHHIIHRNPKSKSYCEEFAQKCPEEVLKCFERIKENKIRREMDGNFVKKVDCPTCGKCMDKGNLRRHNRTEKHKVGEIWGYPCTVQDCNLKFPHKTALWEHYRAHLKRKNKIFSPEFKAKCPKEVLEFLKVKKECLICGKLVKNMSAHKKIHDSPENKQFLCEVCPKQSRNKQNLWAHYRIHLNPQGKTYSEEFAKKCPQEILEFIEKRGIKMNKNVTKKN